MANSKPTKTTLKKGDKLPPRGKSVKTLILDAIRENAILELAEDPEKSIAEKRSDAEKAFFKHVAFSAFDPKDKDRNLCLSLLANKGWPNLKPTNDTVSFEFHSDSKPHEQANQILDAVSTGLLAPDVGVMFIGSIKSMVDIEEYTDLKARIEKLEELINGES